LAQQVRKERAREFNLGQIVGESPAMKKMLGLAAKVAESEVSSVLPQGEFGTGKNLVDRSGPTIRLPRSKIEWLSSFATANGSRPSIPKILYFFQFFRTPKRVDYQNLQCHFCV
jgi:hypothetical protein